MTNFRNKSNLKMMSSHLALGVLLAGLGAVSASADVLYDTTWMTDNETFNSAILNQIAGNPANPNYLIDQGAADDFSLSEVTDLTSVTGDFGTNAPGFGGEGVLVEFFADLGGTPSEVPSAAWFATPGSGLSVTTLNLSIPDATWLRFTVDLSAAGISLGAGDWWMSMVPVHEALPSSSYFQLRQEGFQNGHELHVRSGGIDHGNGYQGLWSVNDWTPISVWDPIGDIAMRVEGTPIPAPSALAALGMLGLGMRRRRRA